MTYFEAAIEKVAKKGHKSKSGIGAPEILEKMGAGPDVVDVARSLEEMSESASKATLLGFWDRLARAAMAAKIYADPGVRKKLMIEQAISGAPVGAAIGGLAGYGLRGGTGAAVGTLAGGALGAGVGALMARRKSRQAEELLKDPLAQKALVSKLYESIRAGEPAQLI